MTTPTKADRSQAVKRRLVFAGQRLSANRLYQAWVAVLPADGSLSPVESLFKEPAGKMVAVGSVYEFDALCVNDRPVSLFEGAQYVETWPDKDQIATWQVASRAASLTKANTDLARRMAADDRIEVLAGQLRELFWQTNHAGRVSLVAWLIEYLLRRP